MTPSLFVRCTLAIACVVVVLVVWLFWTETFNIVDSDGAGADNPSKKRMRKNKRTTATLMLFSASWCPYCKQIVKDWELFCSKYRGADIPVHGGTSTCTLSCVKVDCSKSTSATDAKKQQYGVSGYPTVLIKVGDGTPVYKSSMETIAEFVNRVLDSNIAV